MAGEMHWFRWHHGSVTDPKFQLIARQAGVSPAAVIAVWAVVLEAASAGEQRGKIGPVDTEAVDCLLGFADGECMRILEAMERRHLVSGDEVVSWSKRQPKREREGDNSTDRVREHRARQSGAVSDHVAPRAASESNATPRNATKGLEEIRLETEQHNTASPAVCGVSQSDSKSKNATAEAMRARGVRVSDTHSGLLQLIGQGADHQWFVDWTEKAVADPKVKNQLQWVLACVRHQLDVHDVAADMESASTGAVPWDHPDSLQSQVEAKGVELGLGKWCGRVQFPLYRAQVKAAAAAKAEGVAA